ncbi:MAG TPA: hypothetical protein VL475_12250 [Planctomycetaceae bacterium]|nr:hypothetical protein [Planctomycetaceae bacterium]
MNILIDMLLRWAYGWYSPPAELIQDLAELTNDPEKRLAREPFVIGPMRTGRAFVGAVIAVPFCIWLIGSGINEWNGRRGPAVVIMGVVLLLALAWGLYRLWGVRHSRLTLDLNGVEFQNSEGRLVCPWALFNAVGGPVQSTMPHAVEMPINPTAIPLLALERANLTQEAGSDAKLAEFKLGKKPDTLELGTLYALDTANVARLLLSLGRHFSTPEGAPSVKATSAARQTSAPGARMPAPKPAATYAGGEGAVELKGRRIVMDTVRIVFPPLCCVCGGSTDIALPVKAVTRYLGFFHGKVSFNTAVPCCEACQSKVRLREWLGRGIVFAICLGTGILGTVLLLGQPAWNRLLALEVNTLLLVVVIFVLMLRLLGRYARELVSPIKTRYLSRAKKLSFQFSQPGYAEQVRDHAQNPAAWSPPVEADVR